MSFPFFNQDNTLALLEASEMVFRITPSSTSRSIVVKLRSSATGKPKTGLSYNSAGAVASYSRDGKSPTTFTLVSLANPNAAYTSGGFAEVDPVSASGLYRVDLPNAAVVSGAAFVNVNVAFTGTLNESVLIMLDQPATAATGNGTGAKSHTVNVVNSVTGSPVVAAAVWVSTDQAGQNVIASGRSDAFGAVTFLLDIGTYYLWVMDEDFLANNPTTITVS